jgi:tRNA 2-(methylsulfanyl)-N6-isopentenyladenosine37 hydroxylase
VTASAIAVAVAVAPSNDAWVRAAIADLDTLLIDHAHCEKKAASTAIRFLFKYPSWARLNAQLSRLAREELVHFDRVCAELRERGTALRALPSSGYAAALFAQTRSTADEMLACALIEARSHERFVRLAAAVPDARLAAFYAELADAEARHGELYVELALEAAARAETETAAAAAVAARLAALTAVEADVVARAAQPLRMHSGG